jgi:hypothetical protein
MHPAFVRRRLAPLVTLALAAVVTACGGDVGASRLRKTHAGMPRDSVLQIMGTGAVAATGADTARVVNGFRAQRYLLNGNEVEVLWYQETPGGVNDVFTQEGMTPVVLANDTLAGWGWKYYLADGIKLGIPNALTTRIPQAVAGASTAAPGAPTVNATPTDSQKRQ